MNVEKTVAVVTSSDGVHFTVETTNMNAAYEQAFAAKHTAATLEQHGDFKRVTSLDDLLQPDPPVKYKLVRAPGWRPKLTLIQGGKS